MQLHLFSIQSLFFIILTFMNFDSEKSNPDDVKPQLNQKTSNSHKNSADIFTQTL